ncbi:hypothetical protein TeGR_g11742 [Tetraparma gracilis]|uniref:EXS domain-containing protein n=1 Tax=Tetraparma gracilis TaxID=2962635 RepID=A0ABQ6M712_9STRA|nr:hypothetical protein TeGR_g11742 [Tetraparma gracilis]
MVPLLTVVPLVWRLMQCMRRYNSTRERTHLMNAGKYFSAFTVVVFGVIHPDYAHGEDSVAHNVYRGVWIGLFIFATLYQYTWDVLMDWGLSWTDCRKLTFPKWLYGIFIPLDLVMRFLWTLTLIPIDNDDGPFDTVIVQALSPFLAIVEVTRRLGWALLRIEHEYVSNKDSFERVDFVPVHGEEGGEQEEQEREEEGKNLTSLVWELGLVGGGIIVVSTLAYISPS